MIAYIDTCALIVKVEIFHFRVEVSRGTFAQDRVGLGCAGQPVVFVYSHMNKEKQ